MCWELEAAYRPIQTGSVIIQVCLQMKEWRLPMYSHRKIRQKMSTLRASIDIIKFDDSLITQTFHFIGSQKDII